VGRVCKFKQKLIKEGVFSPPDKYEDMELDATALVQMQL
jgi:hypothetical protein